MSIFIHIFLVGSIVNDFFRKSAFWPFKVIQGTNRKRVCDFLLLRHNNLGPISHRFRVIAGFVLMTWPHCLILGVFPLHQIAHVGVNVRRYLKPCREIIFEVFQVPTCAKNIPERHGRTDRRTDRGLTVS